MNEVLVTNSSENILKELENTQNMCQLLLKTPHYAKLGSAGIFAIVEKAKSMGINPMNALNGGFYFVQGKVEMTAAMMNELIRNNGHSITKDKRSDNTICILHGRRKDTDDTWMESFSIEDAKLAGIYKNQWLRYPKDMLFARALSRLARQLFPDIIKGCYVSGEISEAPSIHEAPVAVEEKPEINIASKAEIEDLQRILDPEYEARIKDFLLTHLNLPSFDGMPKELYDKFLANAIKKKEEREQEAG